MSLLVFDLDGTLVDSGLDFDAMRVEMELPAATSILEAIEGMNEPRATHCRAILAQHEQRGVERSRLMHGVTELLFRSQNPCRPTICMLVQPSVILACAQKASQSREVNASEATSQATSTVQPRRSRSAGTSSTPRATDRGTCTSSQPWSQCWRRVWMSIRRRSSHQP